jgi:hypothetical protein
VWTRQNLFVKELEWMRRQPKARTTKSKSRQEDFTRLKTKHKAAGRKIKEINMERMGSIELHKIPRNSRTMLSWIISVTTFNRENALESSGKWNGKINLKFID